jgi:hypothetical protein
MLDARILFSIQRKAILFDQTNYSVLLWPSQKVRSFCSLRNLGMVVIFFSVFLPLLLLHVERGDDTQVRVDAALILRQGHHAKAFDTAEVLLVGRSDEDTKSKI